MISNHSELHKSNQAPGLAHTNAILMSPTGSRKWRFHGTRNVSERSRDALGIDSPPCFTSSTKETFKKDMSVHKKSRRFLASYIESPISALQKRDDGKGHMHEREKICIAFRHVISMALLLLLAGKGNAIIAMRRLSQDVRFSDSRKALSTFLVQCNQQKSIPSEPFSQVLS